EFLEADGGKHADDATQAIARYSHPALRGAEEPGASARNSVGRSPEVERIHFGRRGFAVVIGHRPAGIEVRPHRVIPGRRVAIADASDLALDAPPFLDHDNARRSTIRRWREVSA